MLVVSRDLNREDFLESIHRFYAGVEAEFYSSFPTQLYLSGKFHEYGVVVADLEFCSDNGFAIFGDIIETPIIAIIDNLYDYSQRVVLEEAILRGAESFIPKNYTLEDIKNTVCREFDRLKHCDSYSNTIINSFVEFHSSSDISSKMISIAKIVCRRYNLPNVERADIYRALKILSVAIKTNSIIKSIKFFENIRIANAILNLLKKSIKPNDVSSNIVHMIYNFQRVLFHNRPLKEYVTRQGDKKIYEEILKIFEQKEIFIESGLDLESIWIDIIEAVNAYEKIDSEDSDEFIRCANLLSKFAIVYSKGAIVKIIKRDNKLEFILTMQDRRDIFDIFLGEIRSSKSRDGVVVTDDMNTCSVILDLKDLDSGKEDELSLKKSMESKKDEIAKSEVLLKFSDGSKRVKISAIDYVQSIEDDIDIDEYLDTLLALEEAVEDALTQSSSLTSEALISASDIFSKYGSFLNDLSDFKELSYVVFTLSSVLRNTDFDSIVKNDRIIYKMLVGVLDDLKNWKITNFITQDSKDIHYLDDSLLSSCSQLESILNINDMSDKAEDSGDDDNDLELF